MNFAPTCQSKRKYFLRRAHERLQTEQVINKRSLSIVVRFEVMCQLEIYLFTITTAVASPTKEKTNDIYFFYYVPCSSLSRRRC